MASIYFVCHFYVAVSEVGYLVVSAAGNEDCGTTGSRCITVQCLMEESVAMQLLLLLQCEQFISYHGLFSDKELFSHTIISIV